jgi:steroid delta-isomerase-like uncharacterized protein
MTDCINIHIIKKFYYLLWNQFEISLIPDLLTQDIQFRGSLGKYTVGHEELSNYVKFIQSTFPDFTNFIEEIITQRDRSFVRLTYRGTHKGEVFGIPPTNKRVEYSGAAVFQIRDDKISDVWVLGDIYGLILQLKESNTESESK